MKTIEILRSARALIEDPSRWTKGTAARNGDGKRCDPESPRAVRWCAHGALQRAESDAGDCNAASLRAGLLAERAARRSKGLTLRLVNDLSDHETVLAVFDRAIEAAS